MLLSEWQAYKARLWDARASGVLIVRDQNGESITYRSDADLASAIAAVDGEIRRRNSSPPNTILFTTSKGI